MKRILLFAIVVLGLSIVTGCTAAQQNSGQPPATAQLTPQDLLHHRFELTAINGVEFTKTERIPTIEFNEGMRVSGQTCNRFMGNGVLKDSTLTISQMASTMMLCADPTLNELERDFSRMMQAGAEIQLENATLTLRRDDYVLTYTLRDLVQ